ncbi:MAG: dicarboxylate/amino acid:cation symporter [Rhodobacteraceae bacterium]|nr:dicarboxylate/amino acid:cation symporter [Paracoccaceae bacterium]
MLKSWFLQPLWFRVLTAMVAGIIAGLLLGPQADALKPIGDLFIRGIKMLVVPLVFISLLSGVISMPNPASLGRIGVKTMALYLVMAPIAVAIGIGFAVAFTPVAGTPVDGLLEGGPPDAKSVSILKLITEIVPTNPIAALAQGDILAIIFIALLIGIAMIRVGDDAQPLRAFLGSANAVIVRITGWVLETAPFGVFALIAWVVGAQGLAVLVPLLKLIVCLYAACLFHLFVISVLLVIGVGRLNVWRFYRGILDAMLVAFSTSTSSGTLPVTLRCLEKNLGVSRSTSTFVASLGATVNMDGTAIYMGMFALFTAQAFGVELGFAQYAAIVFTGTLASIGAAGIPSASLVLLPMVLGSAGLPAEAVALVVGVDRVLDMMRTMTNVTGDAIVAAVVGKLEGTFDQDVFDGTRAGTDSAAENA